MGGSKKELLMIVVTWSLLFGFAFPTISEDTEVGYRCGLIPLFGGDVYNLSRSLVVAGLINNTASHQGFWNESHVQCNGLALCRSDVNPDDCMACVKNASVTLINDRCPHTRSGILCRDDCFVKYSDEDFVGKVDTDNILSLTSSIVFQLASSTYDVKRMLSKLIQNVNRLYYAYGSIALQLYDHTHIDPDLAYGMVQCTRDLSLHDCKMCLNDTLKMVPALKMGERFVKGSCSIRYETYDFIKRPY